MIKCDFKLNGITVYSTYVMKAEKHGYYYAFFILGEIFVKVKRILSFWPDDIVLKEP